MAPPTGDFSLRLEARDHLELEVRREAGTSPRLTLRASNIAVHLYDRDPERLAAALEAAADTIRETLT